jgi:uroporphyrinogen decarboxylase
VNPISDSMTPRQRIENLLAGRPVDRVPFCPAIYEHKAALIGTTPSAMSRDVDLFARALAREAEIYRPDMLTVGCDVYNIEAEALGCEVRFSEANDVPSIAARAIRPGDAISRLQVPDPACAGRMPVYLEAGRRAQARFGRDMIVRGALSAPFSMACELAGAEAILTAVLDDPDWVSELLLFTTEVAKAYGRAFVERGLGVILFDSHASPPLLSPKLYRRIVLPPTATLVAYCRRELGVPLVPYIIGGETASILDVILETGTNNVLCDFRANLAAFVDRLRGTDVLLRANLDPRFLLTAFPTEIKTRARAVLDIGRRHSGFLLGTGILPYDMPPGQVLAVREALEAA